MRKDDLRVIGFAATVCLVCSLVLSATAQLLSDRQAREVELFRKTNVLLAFGVNVRDEAGRRISSDEVDRFFADHISEIFIDRETGSVLEGVTEIPPSERRARTILDRSVLPLYIWKDDGEVTRYAFPTSGMGLWSVLYGFVAIDRDLETIIGLTFYDHGETPGLGGEASEPWFMNQFSNKRFFADGQLQRIEVVKGGVAARYPDGSDHAVDGISGATITGDGITTFLNRDLYYYNRFFATLRES
ncbi:MAG TPA: NADH:ubiquinone reductase (Na(+)-transporting) subunit C [Kiritimatiellia bacterium]|nr:NADH:ubiquinone reductase (Na(+)-transporting) subunit C [Kiritimatiellia bacterium]